MYLFETNYSDKKAKKHKDRIQSEKREPEPEAVRSTMELRKISRNYLCCYRKKKTFMKINTKNDLIYLPSIPERPISPIIKNKDQ
jgi:hypothetical protein